MPTSQEQPRLAVLKNFKDISRMIRANFMVGRERRGLPTEEIEKREREDEAALRLTNVMKTMCQVKRFHSPLKRGGRGAPPIGSPRFLRGQTSDSPPLTQK